MPRSSWCICPASGKRADKCRWHGFYNLIQRSHFKSRNVQKLEAAVKIYAALSEVAPLGQEATAKLTKMLKHPFPKVIGIASLFCHHRSLSTDTKYRSGCTLRS
jgi:hypothetical protein